MLKSFSYDDYIKCIHTLRLNAVLELAEDKENYEIHKKNKDYSYNNLVKEVLKNTKEIANIINECLDLDYIVKEDNLILHKNLHTKRTNNLKYSDIIYKIKEREVFFLINYQSTINKNINLHILNNSIDIINDWCRENRFKKNNMHPIVIPIIIYTGNKKWEIEKTKKEDNIYNNIYGNYKIDVSYNLVDVQRTKNSYLKELFSFIF